MVKKQAKAQNPSKASKRASKRNRRQQVARNRQSENYHVHGHNVPRFIDTSGGSLAASITGAFNYSDPSSFGGSGSNGSRLGIEGSSGNYYLDALVDPSRPPVRIPDLYAKNTAVHQSFFNFTMTPQPEDATGNNLFSVFMNPVLGPFPGAANNWKYHTLTDIVGAPVGTTVSYHDDPDFGTLDGIINELRPTSACIFITYVGDTLTDGGQIAAAFMPSGSVAGTGTPTAADSGNVLYQFAEVSTQPGAYIGPLKKGAFLRWAPEDERDIYFRKGTETNGTEYPVLVVSGISTTEAPNIRVLAWVNYEYTTQALFINQEPSPINTKMIEHAKRALQGMPYVSANDSHGSLWSRFLNWAQGAIHTVEDIWNNDIKPVVSPALVGGGKVLTALGMPELGMPMKGAGLYLKRQ